MATVERKRFDNPDETSSFHDKGQGEIVNIADGIVRRNTFLPGWRWSEHSKTTAGNESCQAPHISYVISGRLLVRIDDGSEHEMNPGDLVAIPPGHDAWTVGDEPCVVLDFAGISMYQKPR